MYVRPIKALKQTDEGAQIQQQHRPSNFEPQYVLIAYARSYWAISLSLARERL